jgi:hypothetical protein
LPRCRSDDKPVQGEWEVRADLLAYAGQSQLGAQRVLSWFMRFAAHTVECEGVLNRP